MYNACNKDHTQVEKDEAGEMTLDRNISLAFAPMKLTVFFGSMIATHLLAVTARYRTDLIIPMLTT
jgi:hypothetical protein